MTGAREGRSSRKSARTSCAASLGAGNAGSRTAQTSTASGMILRVMAPLAAVLSDILFPWLDGAAGFVGRSSEVTIAEAPPLAESSGVSQVRFLPKW